MVMAKVDCRSNTDRRSKEESGDGGGSVREESNDLGAGEEGRVAVGVHGVWL